MGRLLHLLGVLAGVAGWLVLVRLAVRYGNDAQAGDGLSWLWVGVAAAAAVVCLLTALVFLRRLAVLAGLISAYQPKRARR